MSVLLCEASSPSNHDRSSASWRACFFAMLFCFFFCFVCDGQLRVVDFIRTLGPHPFDMNVLLVQQRLGPLWNHFSWPRAASPTVKTGDRASRLGTVPELSLEVLWLKRGVFFTFSGPPRFILYLYSCDICQYIQWWLEPCLAPQVEPDSTFLVTTLCVLVNLLLPITSWWSDNNTTRHTRQRREERPPRQLCLLTSPSFLCLCCPQNRL